VLSGQSDVYSLGCLLHHAIAGKPPFMSDDTVELLKSHALVDPPLLIDVAAAVDPELSSVIRSCLAKEPDDRPTCTELANRLRRIAEAVDDIGVARTVSAPAPTIPETDTSTPLRSARLFWIGGGAALLAVIAIAMIARSGGSSDRTPEPGDSPPVEVSGEIPPPLSTIDAAPAAVVEASLPIADAAPAASPADTRVRKNRRKKSRGWGELMPRQ
jgi:serine/threonine protein kinase